MKITDIETYVLEADIPYRLGWAYNWTQKRHGTLVKVSTDEGIYGWGECHIATESIKFTIDNVLKPLLIGKNPLDIEQLWTHMYHRTKRFGQKGLVVMAIGAVDIALWDIAGKFFQVPIYQLLGGARSLEVPAYATGLYFSEADDKEEWLCSEARGYVDEGFSAVKMKVGFSPQRDIAHARAVREAIGPDIRLMVDANYAYDPVTVINLGRKLEELDVYWIEEPVDPENVDGYVEVTRALDMAVAGGEGEYTRYGFRQLIGRRALDIVQPDIVTAGGLTECRKVSAMADAWGLQCIIHAWGTAIALTAAIHFTAAQTPHTASLNCPQRMIELDRTPNPLRDHLTMEQLVPDRGMLSVPTRPGLGVDVDMDALDKFRVK